MITAFQHIGIGVHDIDRTYDFWKNYLQFSLTLNDHTGYDKEMVPILGDLYEMRMMMAMNVGGGGAIELVQHTSTRPKEPLQKIEWGDLGILEVGLKVTDLDVVYNNLSKRDVKFLMPIQTMPLSNGSTQRFTYLRRLLKN